MSPSLPPDAGNRTDGRLPPSASNCAPGDGSRCAWSQASAWFLLVVVAAIPLACNGLELRTDKPMPFVGPAPIPAEWITLLDSGQWDATAPRVQLAVSANRAETFPRHAHRWQLALPSDDSLTTSPSPLPNARLQPLLSAIDLEFAKAKPLPEVDVLAEVDGDWDWKPAATSATVSGWNLLILIGRQAETVPDWVGEALQKLVIGEQVAIADHSSTVAETPPSADMSVPAASTPPLATRIAAAEAWSLMLARQGREHQDENHQAPLGRLLRDRPDLPAELQAELIWLSAQHVAVERVPGTDTALTTAVDGQRAATEVRRAVVEACILQATAARDDTKSTVASRSPFPVPASTKRLPGMEDCQHDPDGRVRQLYGRWLAISGAAEAFDMLTGQLLDRDTAVRGAACVSLGKLGTDEAFARLETLRVEGEEIDRVQAVRGLSPRGAETLQRFVGDGSLRVRTAVAEELAAFPTPVAAMALQRLAADPNQTVQAAAVASVANWSWPNGLAMPVCLASLEHAALPARRQALSLIREKSNRAVAFPNDSSAADRSGAVRDLASGLGVDLAFWSGGLQTTDESQSDAELTEIEIRQLLQTWREALPGSFAKADAVARLRELDEDDLPLIERQLESWSDADVETFLRQLPAPLSAAHHLLQELGSADVETRRAAATALARLAETASLTPLVLRQLNRRLLNEQDRLVWQFAIQAVLPDGSKLAAEVAHAALEQPWPDVSLHGVRYVRRHPTPDRAAWLLPLIRAPHRGLQLEAVEAIGYCRHPLVLDGRPDAEGGQSRPGLRELLRSSDAELRFTTVIAMCRLQDEQALAELERLFHSPDDPIRRRSIAAAGDLGSRRFVDVLVRVGWTEKNDTVKLAALRSLQQLVPVEDQPARLQERADADLDERMRIWVDWSAARK